MTLSLDQLPIGQHACVEAIRGDDALVQRLLEMGLLEGEPVEVLAVAPLGDPLEVRLRDYRLSLRRTEAARVLVTRTGGRENDLQMAGDRWPMEDGPDHLPSGDRPPVSPSPRPLVVALVGNPNTGKTTLFNALAGLRQHVGNYPGVTVEMKKGRLTHDGRVFELVDLPGTYSLAARSPDEMVAVDLLLGRQEGEPRPDVVVSIVDASNLERNLYLTTQVLELGVPVVVALNMTDLAEAQGVRIDVEALGRRLGVRVVPIQANRKVGLDQLKESVAAAMGDPPPSQRPSFPAAFERETAALAAALGGAVPAFLVRRLLLDVGGYTERSLADGHGGRLRELVQPARQRLAECGCSVPAVEARARYGWIREVTAHCVQRPAQQPVLWTDRFDRLLTHRLWGTLIFLALMFLVFQSIFTWATPLMDLIKDGKAAVASVLGAWLPPGPFTSLLLEGVLEGVGSVLVFLPQILILFGFIAVLEDCGYMARAAFLMDRLMACCGLSGKSFIPLLSSVACAVPGIMAARVLEDRRDRLATILVAPLLSCSARLPVYVLLIGAFLTDGFGWWVPGVTLFAMYALGLVLAPLVALLLKRTLLRGPTPVFILEMPLYKWPAAGTVLRRMADSGWSFVRRAGTLILATMVLVWALLYFPRGDDGTGQTYEERIITLRDEVRALEDAGGDPKETAQAVARKKQHLNELNGAWKRQSWLGRAGRAIEPAVRPLGWDWRIGMAAVASFPAREVVVGTLSIVFNLGQGEPEELRESLGRALREARHANDPGRPLFTVPVALSLMVFFALCCQCASTLVVIRRETGSWGWPLFTFVYMTGLAYLGALAVYQVGSRLL